MVSNRKVPIREGEAPAEPWTSSGLAGVRLSGSFALPSGERVAWQVFGSAGLRPPKGVELRSRALVLPVGWWLERKSLRMGISTAANRGPYVFFFSGKWARVSHCYGNSLEFPGPRTKKRRPILISRRK